MSVATTMAVILLLVPSSLASASVNQRQPLRAVSGLTAGETFTLDSLATCDVFDGLTIIKNTDAKSIRIVRLNAIIPTEATPLKDKITYQLRSFHQGSTTGAVGAVANMPVLGGRVLGSAAGGILRPIASSSLWYVVLFRIKVIQPHASEWVIRGLRIYYTVGQRSFSTVLGQTVRLPRTNC
ncbi:MAG TPA: hypothetical protein VMU68_00840 [Acidimicrobiales bacterium]|nr:hypothetical protein [Acidimicrobiales bacterium]